MKISTKNDRNDREERDDGDMIAWLEQMTAVRYEAARIFQEAEMSARDVAGFLRRALRAKPNYQLASEALVNCLWDTEDFGGAIDEIDRLYG